MPPVPSHDPAAQTATLFWVRRALGQPAMSDRRAVAYITQLIANRDFPKPLPSPVRGGGITPAVTKCSIWIKSAVEAWLAGFIPPDCAATIDTAAMHAAATEMDGAAANLRLIGGRDYRGDAA